ncbi:MAG: class II fructose-bisphosphatase [Hyphomicrobiales bacterium]|nr:class II fructose-bisphosphatase [Hyphomicrobiales bacterium]
MRNATPSQSPLTRALSLEVARVTEAAAVAAARWRGKGDEAAADRAAAEAMRRELASLPVRGRVVIGEGDREETPLLFIGEEIGAPDGLAADIAVDPLEGSTICAKAQPNALTVLAIAEGGTLLKAPDIYMDKIAIGPGFAPDLVHLDFAPAKNLARLAEAKGVPVAALTACILDRPRHARLIAEVRAAGASVQLIGDGDIAGVIQACEPAETGIDIYMGLGGAPEGVLAAAALRCIGGRMQGRLSPQNEGERRMAADLGVKDIARVYTAEEMASGDVIFAATGVTDGALLDGVRIGETHVETHTLIMRGATGTIRWVRTKHRKTAKFAV